MKRICTLMTAIMFMAWISSAMGQLIDAQPCQFYYIDKTVKARIGAGEDAFGQVNIIKALWPVKLNGKDCTKLQEALCYWLTGKDNIKQMDKALEEVLYTDNESTRFGDNGPYIVVDNFGEDEMLPNRNLYTIELKRMGNRFVTFSLFSDMYFSGAAHGMYAENYITYDTQLDKVVTLEDILVDPELLRPYIVKSIEITYGYTRDDLFLPEDEIPHIPSIFYCEDGLVHLCYMPYEIGGFAQGTIDVPIYYPDVDEAPEYLTPYGKEVIEASRFEELW